MSVKKLRDEWLAISNMYAMQIAYIEDGNQIGENRGTSAKTTGQFLADLKRHKREVEGWIVDLDKLNALYNR